MLRSKLFIGVVVLLLANVCNAGESRYKSRTYYHPNYNSYSYQYRQRPLPYNGYTSPEYREQQNLYRSYETRKFYSIKRERCRGQR